MSSPTVDRAYANLLSYLQRPGSGISSETVVSAIPYYLSQLPLPHPTQLTAFVISSPLWKPISVHTVASLLNGYRSAILSKEKHIQIATRGWFERNPQTLLAEWAAAVMKGVSRGDPQLRVAIVGGLLLGLNDLGHREARRGVWDRLESQVVIACAEMLEAVLMPGHTWTTGFGTRELTDVGDRDSLFLYSASHILPLVTNEKLGALDLSAFIHLLNRGVQTAFSSGKFLSQLSHATIRKPDGRVAILPESGLRLSLRKVNNSALYKNVGHIAKLLYRCLSLLADQDSRSSWRISQDVSKDIESLTYQVEMDWKRSLLASLTSENDLQQESRELSTEIWKVLKTLLFAHLVVSQSIVSSITYLPTLPDLRASGLSPSSIARSTLRSLYHLSFVISQFGGVASSPDGFKELKRVFYMSLDIVSADPDPMTGASFVNELMSSGQESGFEPIHPFRQSQTAYVLVVVEQLMPTLDDLMIEAIIVPFCHSYLSRPEHRETYESAHSVMLSIFTWHSNQIDNSRLTSSPSLGERLVPFYVDLLLQDFAQARLNASQLKLAYSSLVRSVASTGNEALTWLCIYVLLTRIETPAFHRSSPSEQMPLYLSLVSLISRVPLSLLSRVLSEVEKVLGNVDGDDKAELGRAILEELTNNVGDREKEAVLSWWCRVAPDSIKAEAGQPV